MPQIKSELQERLHLAYQKLIGELVEINDPDSRIQSLEGQISICDLLAYQIGWGKLLLGWELAEKKGQQPDMPAKGYKWNQLGALACSFYETYQHYSFSELRLEFEKIVKAIMQWIDHMGEKELSQLNQRQWTGQKWPIVKWIQVNTIAPYTSARKKIRKWKKENQK